MSFRAAWNGDSGQHRRVRPKFSFSDFERFEPKVVPTRRAIGNGRL